MERNKICLRDYSQRNDAVVTQNSPKVSVVLPTYNGAKYIRQSIDSCLKQTYSNIELIIVDDGSTDETFEIIDSYEDKRIKFIEHKKNRGLPHALNTGFKNATGEYLTWTSDDNYYAREAIEVMVKTLDNNKKIDFIYSNYWYIDGEGNKVKAVNRNPAEVLKMGNYLGPCFLYRRKVYLEVGEFDSDYRFVEDYEYWLRVRQKFLMCKIDEYLYYYRRHNSSITARYGMEKINKQRDRVRRKYFRVYARCFWDAKRHFKEKEYCKAMKLIVKSLFFNPLYFKAWVLFTFLLFTFFRRWLYRLKRAILR